RPRDFGRPGTPELLAENRVVLVHVAHVVRARESKRAVLVERHVVERHRNAQVLRKRRGVFRTRQDLARDAEPLTGGRRTALENAVGTPADMFRGDARQFAAAEWKRERD